MKKYNAFSYYYTLLAVNILVVGSVFFMEMPFKLIIPLGLLPSLIFLWLNVTNPSKVSDTDWSYRVISVIAILAILGTYGFYMNSQMVKNENASSEETSKIDELNQKIGELKDEISSLKGESEAVEATDSAEDNPKEVEGASDEQISDLIKYLESQSATNSAEPSSEENSTSSNKIVGYVSLVSKSEADVYKSNDKTSRIVGLILSKNKYPYYESRGDWYLVEYDAGQKGWVVAADMKEVN